ncbi:MAG TPA: hypothetical protein VGM41_17305 [Chitinophagaceae bacterium]|jgi:hypothetical protein
MAQTKPSPQRPKKTEEPNLLARFGYDNPYDFIGNFLSNFELEEMDDLLYKFLRCWLTSNDIEHLNSRGRDAVVFFYEELRVLVRASYMIQKERTKKEATVHHVMP